jgi:hypothetical protein
MPRPGANAAVKWRSPLYTVTPHMSQTGGPVPCLLPLASSCYIVGHAHSALPFIGPLRNTAPPPRQQCSRRRQLNNHMALGVCCPTWLYCCMRAASRDCRASLLQPLVFGGVASYLLVEPPACPRSTLTTSGGLSTGAATTLKGRQRLAPETTCPQARSIRPPLLSWSSAASHAAVMPRSRLGTAPPVRPLWGSPVSRWGDAVQLAP